MPTRRCPKYLDLFSGAGGFSAGLEAAGFSAIGSVEIDPLAAESFRTNFPNTALNYHGPVNGDIRQVSPRSVLRKIENLGLTELDLLVAAPPCQGFSRVGRGKLISLAEKKQAFLQDTRNQLYRHAIEFLKTLRPKCMLFENVAGILHLGGTNMAELICKEIAAQGYIVKCALLNSAWYGVPQTRERVFIVGYRADLGITPSFPPIQRHVCLSRGHLSNAELDPCNWADQSYFISHQEIGVCEGALPAVTVEEAFSGLPRFTAHLRPGYRANRSLQPQDVKYPSPCNYEYDSIMRNWPWNSQYSSEFVRDHICRYTPRDFQTFSRMKHGDKYPEAVAIATDRYREALNSYSNTKELKNNRRPRKADFIPPYKLVGFPDKWRKLIPGDPSWTITAHLGKDTYSHIHYDSTQARMITIREAARLQSFPDGFHFCGNMGDAFRQIGNAVPPLMAKAIGERLFAVLSTDHADEADNQRLAS